MARARHRIRPLAYAGLVHDCAWPDVTKGKISREALIVGGFSVLTRPAQREPASSSRSRSWSSPYLKKTVATKTHATRLADAWTPAGRRVRCPSGLRGGMPARRGAHGRRGSKPFLTTFSSVLLRRCRGSGAAVHVLGLSVTLPGDDARAAALGDVDPSLRVAVHRGCACAGALGTDRRVACVSKQRASTSTGSARCAECFFLVAAGS